MYRVYDNRTGETLFASQDISECVRFLKNNNEDHVLMEETEEHLEKVREIISSWPEWKKEIFERLVRLTT